MGQRRWFVRRYVANSLRVIALPDNEHAKKPGNRAESRDGAGSGTGHSKTEWRVCPYCGNDARFNRRNATYSPHTSDDSGEQCRRPGR
ncbi:hypothetical protein DFQ14_102156 [Halopolyspora algeriensis]|uniref:Uncharacterized protein n=1 Tax=Halopolyspora algeriensis TaxID=1500506 RepID=A0A368VVD4_9ACTN|nr:hypothetical protein [Halopolyspora algeriensis]RCW45855.1 hypothetical protein DFQ14_102156 [Halopolyspora algeriensis]TQM55270.1 hypothetical protein FHU43_0030 [Halopolyspora algeriensis]